tara:strand:+ start:33179 stop:35335 length:2157 start_codon:yes stop_codon:yes gene_type:complete
MFENNYTKQLVLIGGGHANVQVLKKLCMNRVQGLHTILISEHYEATYSGMTPGYIHKDFTKEEISIDLQRLCFNAGATFIKDKVIKLDTNTQKLDLQNYPSVNYDLLSINTGSVSNTKKINIRNSSRCFFVKPIGSLVKNLKKIDLIIKNKKCKISIIGGGVASYELAFSLKRRYEETLEIKILGRSILAEKNLNTKTKNNIRKIAKNLNIKELNVEVASISENYLSLKNSEKITFDLALLSTGASIETWLSESNLYKDESGFITVDDYLLSINEKNIFVTGDACSIKDNNRPKSGVMAVRQGEILKENIFFKLTGKKLIKFKPQQNWLYLIGTYQNHALLNYFFISVHSKWCWMLKVWIDRNFIKKFKFNDNLIMKKKSFVLASSKDTKMYCQGCGSKVSKNNLVDYIKKSYDNINLADSSVIKNHSTEILQTIDHVKLFSSLNPFDFGRISYLHSQNDILAAGGIVKYLNVSIGVPFSEDFIEKFYLEYFMEGIKFEADKDKCVISSGHSFQSNDSGITLNLNGEIESSTSKNSAEENDLIYLSKPLGVGYLLAAYFNNSKMLSSNDFKNIIDNLKRGNLHAVNSARGSGSKTMTDISGYGLSSHLIDICLLSNLSCELIINKNILINSNIDLLKLFQSTGFENNYKSSNKYIQIANKHPLKNILYDPQTNGPMLMAIKKQNQEKFENFFFNKSDIKPILIGKFINKLEKIIYVNE